MHGDRRQSESLLPQPHLAQGTVVLENQHQQKVLVPQGMFSELTRRAGGYMPNFKDAWPSIARSLVFNIGF